MTQPRKRAGLGEMAMVASDEAARIRATQAAIVRGGMRTEPAAREIRKAEVFEDIARLIFAIQPVRDAVLKILKPVLAAMQTAEDFKKTEPEHVAPAPDADENKSND